MNKILFYDNDSKIIEAFRDCSEEKSFEIELISRFSDLLSVIGPNKYRAVILNLEKKPSDGDIGIKELIYVIKKLDPSLPIIVTTEKSSIEEEREIRTAGIFFYMIKPFNSEEIKSVLEEIIS